MFNKLAPFCFYVLVFWVQAAAIQTAASPTVEEEQQQAIQKLISDMNVSVSTAASGIITVPADAKEGGCLDGFVITANAALVMLNVGIIDVWGLTLEGLKNIAYSYACSAVNDWAQSQANKLAGNLSVPGYFSASITPNSNTNQGGGSMSATDLETSATTGNLGKIPAPLLPTGGASVMSTSKYAPSVDHEIWDLKMGEAFDLKVLWGD